MCKDDFLINFLPIRPNGYSEQIALDMVKNTLLPKLINLGGVATIKDSTDHDLL